jgi:outer membrane lipoprotein-sorting protein
MDLLLALRDVGIVAPQPDDAGDRLIRTALDREIARVSRSAPGDVRTTRRARRRVVRRALALSVPATAAAATTATLLLTAGGASGPSLASAAIIRHVRAELTAPPGSILHESATVTLPDGSSMPFELWVQTGGTGVYRVIKGGQEVSLSDTKNEIYNPSTNTVTVSPLPPAIHQLEVSKGGDLADELKRMVDSGQATATPTTYNGVPAYELSLNPSGDNLPNGTAYVARSDYRPLEIDSTSPRGEKVVFSAYEYLPATPANDALLAVTSAHPGATVVNQP